MDNFQVIYKILSTLERSMDRQGINISQIGAQNFRISEERWARYMEMLNDCGFIKGVTVKKNICGDTRIEGDDIRITLKGLEYLCDNSIMKRIYRALKSGEELLPPKY